MAQTAEQPLSERDKVESWRLHVLIEAGYPLPLAERIAHSDADLHRAVELVLAGCRHDTAAEILRVDERRDPTVSIDPVKVEATEIDGRKVYSVRAFNQGVGSWLGRLPSVWVDGEITELRRQERWQSVFFTLKDPESGAGIGVQMQRGISMRWSSTSPTGSASRCSAVPSSTSSAVSCGCAR